MIQWIRVWLPVLACAAAAGQSTEPTVLRVTTRLVELNVIARDARGNPVPGLAKSDFTLLDDGHSVDIAGCL